MSRRPVVIITGASKGIGLAVTKILLEKFNANVVTISRTRTPDLLELMKVYSSNILVIEASVTDEVALTQAITLAEKTYQSIDGLILNAGVIEPLGRIDSVDVNLESWKAHFDVNFFSLITALKASLPALRKNKGRVVFVSSGASIGGTAALGPYNAGKAALNSLCRTLEQEEPDVVSVALRPGMVDTGMLGILRTEGAAHMAEIDHQKFANAHAEGKLVDPADSGHVIAALSIAAPKSLSGQFVSWDSEECKEFRNE